MRRVTALALGVALSALTACDEVDLAPCAACDSPSDANADASDATLADRSVGEADVPNDSAPLADADPDGSRDAINDDVEGSSGFDAAPRDASDASRASDASDGGVDGTAPDASTDAGSSAVDGGSDGACPGNAGPKPIRVAAFCIDATEVTNDMITAASLAVAGYVGDGHDAGEPALVPPIESSHSIARAVALAIARQAVLDGVAPPRTDAALAARIEASCWYPNY